ncbi:hypothetical protein [Hathewaya limosa]|uniref:Uncharacterized protein n=1 Tax=Hathewaya limosa TaxID=1536 RepID=A0ABU0JU70_HATLI|nr:hypothetical protein [Hathewaya limosa]MDQ0480652.1 hypothetical protein [Hathewaya limosa]
MMFLPTIIIGTIVFLFCFYFNKKNMFKLTLIFFIIGFFITGIVYLIDLDDQIIDTEVWSGNIEDVEHKEEWDEFHPQREETYTTTDSKGNTITKIKIIPAYTEHHKAINKIQTTDNGWITVYEDLDGKVSFSDKFPNTKEELLKFYPIGKETVSIHTYENKVQASYSIYNHKDIDLDKYRDLPKYPNEMKNLIEIDRFIGSIPNKDKVMETLNKVNSELNNNSNKKQINLIFVNLGDKSSDYGFALQDYWKCGNKNDFIICFGSRGEKVTWAYPFSWADSEKSEKLKIDVRNYMLKANLKSDFTKVIEDINPMIKRNFQRKEFADFNYLNVELSTKAYIYIAILNLITGVGIMYCCREM